MITMMAKPANNKSSNREMLASHTPILKLLALPFTRIKQINAKVILIIHNPKISQKPINLKMLKNSVIAVNISPQTRAADKKELRQQEVARDF